ncbi:hypothetical protein B0T13DRAFT_180850 [Neurospora crassa]|nr:hypothetical protein B0T13DRAFT_180850 [Neurospora crassa]
MRPCRPWTSTRSSRCRNRARREIHTSPVMSFLSDDHRRTRLLCSVDLLGGFLVHLHCKSPMFCLVSHLTVFSSIISRNSQSRLRSQEIPVEMKPACSTIHVLIHYCQPFSKLSSDMASMNQRDAVRLGNQPQETRSHAFVQISALPSSTSKVWLRPPFVM